MQKVSKLQLRELEIDANFDKEADECNFRDDIFEEKSSSTNDKSAIQCLESQGYGHYCEIQMGRGNVTVIKNKLIKEKGYLPGAPSQRSSGRNNYNGGGSN